MRRRMALLAVLALVTGSASACAGGPKTSVTSAQVDPVQDTTLHTGDVTLRIPPGAASSGTVTLTAATPPDQVPAGLEALGPAAAVLLAGGTLASPATLSFAAPSTLRSGDLPVVVWRTRTGWTWLPTSWRSGDHTVDVSFSQPSAGYLAKVDVASWVEGFRKSFLDRVTTSADVSPPYCAGQAAAATAGLASGSDPGTQLRWCVGVEDGRPVLRVTNETKLVTEVTYPLSWQADPGMGALGSAVRSALGMGTPPPVGRAARYVGGGETLTLHPVPSSTDGAAVVGDVTAELTPTAWIVSSLLDAADVYSTVVGAADPDLRKTASAAAQALPEELAGGLPPGGTGAPALRAVHACLAPVTGTTTLDPATAAALLDATLHCVPQYFAPALARSGAGPAGVRLVTHVGAVVLKDLRQTLTTSAGSWDAFSGTTKDSMYRIWLGTPPAQELDYEDAPLVFHVGDPVDVPAWSPEFRAYVRARLQGLTTSSGTAASCPDGTITVRRYQTDGFALAGEVSCDGVPHQLVLADVPDGWHEVDDTPSAADEPGHYFDCNLMQLASVPAFIVGSQCISGSGVQDYR